MIYMLQNLWLSTYLFFFIVVPLDLMFILLPNVTIELTSSIQSDSYAVVSFLNFLSSNFYIEGDFI